MVCHAAQAFTFVQREAGWHVKTSKIPAISPPLIRIMIGGVGNWGQGL